MKDRITGEEREVDVLVEYSMGTVKANIVIECRDRKATQDVTWIEQVHTKVNDLRINKTIAVSSSGFTEAAMKKAAFLGIETRTFSEINVDIIKSWWKLQFIDTITNEFHVVQSSVFTENLSESNE